MIDKIAARHGLVATARVAGERNRIAPWNKPFDGLVYEDMAEFDTWPLIRAYVTVERNDVEDWVLKSMQEEVRTVLRDAAERGEIKWVRSNLSTLSGSSDRDAVDQQLQLIALSRKSDLKLYAFIMYSQPVMFFAKPGWERSVFTSAVAEERFGRFADGLKKYLRAN